MSTLAIVLFSIGAAVAIVLAFVIGVLATTVQARDLVKKAYDAGKAEAEAKAALLTPPSDEEQKRLRLRNELAAALLKKLTQDGPGPEAKKPPTVFVRADTTTDN